MSSYDKSDFRQSRKSQYAYFRHILQYSILGVALTLVFLALMLKYAW